ncbi:MAG: Fe-S cluster assembly protein IscX [Candidatus Midichloria sp.]|uniref:Fe-S cluster assembly protein IscX n=1 Tax=Hyalomma marginatum TaxID=34627 RepID=A0A8S4C0R4_9ACAR|nr:Fe-S cluster assembly protein IscX [Candidatus Midichloria sp.]CAG7591446.1 Fe-S cluster assembly protein IscX [Hyalomma marginatum]CAG7592366.1 Fe-S cluster assembly protein IscX [Hyalomma marginatum]
MRWIDIYDIAISLEEKYPDIDIINIGFPKLKEMVISLNYFDDLPNRSNEKILEAIQAAWLEERVR